MPSSGMLRCVALPLSSSETSVLVRATRRNIPEDAILHCHCCENLKSYDKYICFTAHKNDMELTETDM
jgi:hypothetical protein